ncbi:MAG: hypothetical protein QOG91_293 [Candidatus Parcubacteria bacterium]|jgi:hypothetical protein|nr:hypothetical protein [Candidatus Parcubacteria bacterium]
MNELLDVCARLFVAFVVLGSMFWAVSDSEKRKMEKSRKKFLTKCAAEDVKRRWGDRLSDAEQKRLIESAYSFHEARDREYHEDIRLARKALLAGDDPFTCLKELDFKREAAKHNMSVDAYRQHLDRLVARQRAQYIECYTREAAEHGMSMDEYIKVLTESGPYGGYFSPTARRDLEAQERLAAEQKLVAWINRNL